MEDVPRATSSIGRSSLRSALVISLTGVIVASLAITLYHYIMIRYCIRRRAAMAAAAAASAAAGGTAQSRPFTGVDEKILETIPIYAFTAVKSGIDQDECAVCLGELEDGDSVRLLPTCKHAFHVACIDRWFTAQMTCPLCRYPVVDEETNPDVDGVSDSDVPSIEDSDLESETVNSTPIAIENTGNNRESSSTAAVEQPLQLLFRHPSLSVDRRPPAPASAPRLLERSMSLDPKLICRDLQRNLSTLYSRTTTLRRSGSFSSSWCPSRLDRRGLLSAMWLRSLSRLRVGKATPNGPILPY